MMRHDSCRFCASAPVNIAGSLSRKSATDLHRRCVSCLTTRPGNANCTGQNRVRLPLRVCARSCDDTRGCRAAPAAPRSSVGSMRPRPPSAPSRARQAMHVRPSRHPSPRKGCRQVLAELQACFETVHQSVDTVLRVPKASEGDGNEKALHSFSRKIEKAGRA